MKYLEKWDQIARKEAHKRDRPTGEEAITNEMRLLLGRSINVIVIIKSFEESILQNGIIRISNGILTDEQADNDCRKTYVKNLVFNLPREKNPPGESIEEFSVILNN